MNASLSSLEASDKRSTSGEAPPHAPPGGRRPRPRSGKQVVLFILIFGIMAGFSWLMLNWFAALHDLGQLFTKNTVNAIMLAVVALAVIVVVPVMVSTCRSARENVRMGEGLLSAASSYLDSQTRNPLLTKEDFKGGLLEKMLGALSRQAQQSQKDAPDHAKSAETTEDLSSAQDEACRRIKDFNAEMENVFPRWQQRIGAYEQRVEELEKELSAKDSQNTELLKRQIELVHQHLNLARDKFGEDDTEFEVRPDTPAQHRTGNLQEFVSGRNPETNEARKAAELTRQFGRNTESLSKEDKIKVYEQRIAAMEAELAGTEAANKELTWNQLHLMQEKLAALTGPRASRPAATDPNNDTPPQIPKQVAGFKTEVRRCAALRVAELNERLAQMYPNSDDRIAAYEDRLARIEEELSTRNSENKELLQCQMEMTRNHFRLMQGVPELGQHAPASSETLSQMFGLQFGLNETQQEAARQVAKFNRNLNNSNTSNDGPAEAYKRRIAELEAEVERKDHENRELYETQLELVQYQLDHLEQTNLCDEPMDRRGPMTQPAENGIPVVKIPHYRKVAIKEEIPREIRVLLDRKPTTLKIQGLGRKKPKQASS